MWAEAGLADAGPESDRASSTPLVEVEGLVKHFPASGMLADRRRVVRAVDGISFTIDEGTTFALVGESGCGKTTTARMLLRLERPTGGTIRLRGRDVSRLQGTDAHRYTRAVQAVFQDPYSSLSPRLRVREIVGEPLQIHRRLRGRELTRQVDELLDMVGLSPAAARAHPHQFSGGQRQRIALARALSLSPDLIVLDEPVSALDVAIRAQILNLLVDLQERLRVSYLLISHDMAIVRHMAHTVAVMYAGQIVECAATDDLFSQPRHPYTGALIAAVPQADPDVPIEYALSGEPPDPVSPPGGCRFHPRCPIADARRCPTEEPLLRELTEGHIAACLLAEA